MPDTRNQTTITLSWRAAQEYEVVAEWLGIAPASLMRFILEEHHRSAEFYDLLQRARACEAPPRDKYVKSSK
jgi:hypothetical protein